MALGRSAPMLTSASPGRGGGDGAGADRAQRATGSSTTDRKICSTDRSGACPRSLSAAAAAAPKDQRNLAASTNRAVVTRAREAAPIPARSASRPTCLTGSGRLGGAAAAGRRRQFFLAKLLLAASGADDGARAIGADADRLRLVGAAAMVPAPIERREVRGHRQQIGKSAALTVAPR